MCSFFFLRLNTAPDSAMTGLANRFAKDRGPDYTGSLQFLDQHGYSCTFLHNLLDISGLAVKQPRVEGSAGDRTVLLFNGEIYNHSRLHEASADTECLIPIIRRNDGSLCEVLDGEFAIVTYDERRQQLQVAVDPFLTKPLFIGRSADPAEFGVATCATSLKAAGLEHVEMVTPNSLLTATMTASDVLVEAVQPAIRFDLRQDEGSYDAWMHAFMQSVRKRATHGSQPIAVFLSSGYDSGAICLALNLLGIPYTTFSVLGQESADIIAKRCQLNQQAVGARSVTYQGLSPAVVQSISHDIRWRVEPFSYQHEDRPGWVCPVWEDGGAIGAWFLADQARQRGCLVNLSGSGADEILSDYGIGGKRFYPHSQFGGLFPHDLNGFFPWRKFYGDTQRSYLFKDEYILGRFGVEGRYPFLDRAVVQEFLRLAPALKNARYKAPVAVFLERHGYPFEESVKRGFAPSSELQPEPVFRKRSRLAGWLGLGRDRESN